MTSPLRARLRPAALGAVTAAAVVPLLLAGCSTSSSSAAPTVTVTETSTPTDTASPTDTPTPTDTSSPTDTMSPTGTPTTVTPTPTGTVKGITLAVTPTSVAANQRIDIFGRTDVSLAGKLAYTVKTTGGSPKVIGSGVAVNSSGTVRSYAQLLTSGTLMLVIPTAPLTVGPYNPTTPLLAQSSEIAVTVK